MTNTDKYKALIEDIANMISDKSRKNYLLECELASVKAQLEMAQETIKTLKKAVDRNAE